MRMTEVNIPKEQEPQNGLDNIVMKRLGQIVLLVGKNGSGKSRLLDKVSQVYKQKPTPETIEKAKSQFKIISGLLKRDQKELNMEAMEFKRNMTQWENQVIGFQDILSWDAIQTDITANAYSIIHFVPKNLNLQDPNGITPNQLGNYSNQSNTIGVNHSHKSTLSKLQELQNKWFNVTHQNTTIEKGAKDKIIDEYKQMQHILQEFIGVKLDRNVSGIATLFGLNIGKAELSDGQKVLLQLCVAIHCQGGELNELILFMDEPENHLHPGAIIEVLDTLRNKLPNGQIWIATHSIPILAHLHDSSSLWFIDKGKVTFGGKTPEIVLESLLGTPDRIAKMNSFMDHPAQLALNRYAYECLCPPEVVMTDADDPQTNQIRINLSKSYNVHSPVKILDFGAGKGRLLANLADYQDETKELHQKLDYIAIDTSDNDKEECIAVIERIYETNAENRYFNSYSNLLSAHSKGEFHLIILCNVLHEIHPDTWGNLFGADGRITELLADNGYLLLVEHQRVPVGEKAYKEGFVVLDTPALKELFPKGSGENPSITFDSAEGREHLKAHLIPKIRLANFTVNSKIKALKEHHKIAKEEIERLRSAEVSRPNGQLHAFWIQQFTNTSLLLENC